MLTETMPPPPSGWKYGGMKIVKTGDMYYSPGMGWIVWYWAHDSTQPMPAAAKDGREPRKYARWPANRNTAKLMVRLPLETRERLNAACERAGTSVNRAVCAMLDRMVMEMEASE